MGRTGVPVSPRQEAGGPGRRTDGAGTRGRRHRAEPGGRRRPVVGWAVRRAGEERGSALVLVALAMAVLLGFGAVSIDAGRAFVTVEHLNQVASAAAVSGVQYLPDDPAGAQAAAVDYAGRNGIPPDQVTAYVAPGGTELQVRVGQGTDWLFARIWGLLGTTFHAQASAQVGTAGGVRGATPFGVPQQPFVYGQTYTLKQGPGQGQYGDYCALALGSRGVGSGGSGGSNDGEGDGESGDKYRQNVEYGYSGWVRVGDSVWTEPGVMAGPTYDAVQSRIDQDPEADPQHVSPRSPRLAVVPVVDGCGHGRSQVTVLGFAVFFLEGCDQTGTVTGVFLRRAVSGEFCPLGTCGDWGARVVRLDA
jgi:Flp pilus assembly protein TadG